MHIQLAAERGRVKQKCSGPTAARAAPGLAKPAKSTHIGGMNWNQPDLTQHPPRSPRVRLGGYALLARMLDKCRAELAGKNGEYHYDCPNDQQFLSFAGIDAAALKQQVAAGKGDGDILEWVRANARHPRTAAEIEAWSQWQDRRAPDNPDGREYFNEVHAQVAPGRTDIVAWADLLDLDDFASFGGKV
jgi:hypothetical protein